MPTDAIHGDNAFRTLECFHNSRVLLTEGLSRLGCAEGSYSLAVLIPLVTTRPIHIKYCLGTMYGLY